MLEALARFIAVFAPGLWELVPLDRAVIGIGRRRPEHGPCIQGAENGAMRASALKYQGAIA